MNNTKSKILNIALIVLNIINAVIIIFAKMFSGESILTFLNSGESTYSYIDAFIIWKKIDVLSGAVSGSSFLFMLPFYLIVILLVVMVLEIVLMIINSIKGEYSKQTSNSKICSIMTFVISVVGLLWMGYVDFTLKDFSDELAVMITPFFAIPLVIAIACIIISKKYESTMYYINVNNQN